MTRKFYIYVLFSVSLCLARGSTYTCNSMPVPEINYLNTPYEQIKDINDVLRFDGRPSYDPEGNVITEWRWDFLKFNGTSWDFLFTLIGPDKAVVNCKFSKIGLYKAQLRVRAGAGGDTGRWNQDSDIKEVFFLIIDVEIECQEYIAVGSELTFTYIIRLPKEIQETQLKEACLTMYDEQLGMEIVEIRLKNPVIGKEAAIEWDGKANKGPNKGEFIPPGSFKASFRVIPFRIMPQKTISQKDLKDASQH